MCEAKKIGCSLPANDLTNDNASSSNHTTQYVDLTGSERKSNNHSPELIDLTEDYEYSSIIPVIDLTGDDDESRNYRIPIIDLTDDDVQDITYQTQCVDLTSDDASTCKKDTIRDLNLVGTDYRDLNRSTKLIDLIDDDINNLNPNEPVIDLISDNHQFLNHKIQEIDITDDITQDITHRLQNVDLTHDKQQHKNQYIPTIESINHRYQNIDRILPLTDLTSDKDLDDRSDIDLKRNDQVIREPVEDVEMYDLNRNDSLTSFQNDVIENNLRIPIVNLSHNVAENDDLKCNETSKIDVMHVATFSGMQKLDRRKETSRNHPQTTFQSRKETILTNHPKTNNIEEKYSSPENPKKITQNKSFDMMKPAHRPIPYRHSLGRSIVNTSKNVPIEDSEDKSHTLTVSSIIRRRSEPRSDISKYNTLNSSDRPHTSTVSSIIRRKKSEPRSDISRSDSQNSLEPSASTENTFLFDNFQRNFWIFLLLILLYIFYRIILLV